MPDMLDRAIAFAANAHSGQLRKGTNTPYIVHPMEAASIVSTMTDDREVIAAAVLHDTLEDCDGVTYDQLEQQFGQRIADLVQAESEVKEADAKASWQRRKQAAIHHLREAPVDVLMIALGDKLSNIRAIARDYREEGEALWERFNQKDKEKHAWYYDSLRECFTPLMRFSAYLEYSRLVAQVFEGSESAALDTGYLDSDLLINAGLAYENGDGVEQNYAKAFRLYARAAEQGNWAGYNNMGWMFQNGYGVSKNIDLAIKAYVIAANEGISRAMVNLGNLFEFGEDVEQDYAQAFKWYSCAAEHGDSIGEFNLANLYHHGYGVERNPATAYGMFKKLYEEGDTDCCFHLGLYHQKGIVVERDYAKALQYYREGAEENDMHCLNQLGVMYGLGLGVERDVQAAEKYYRLAALQGDTLAKFNLAAIESGEAFKDEE